MKFKKIIILSLLIAFSLPVALPYKAHAAVKKTAVVHHKVIKKITKKITKRIPRRIHRKVTKKHIVKSATVKKAKKKKITLRKKVITHAPLINPQYPPGGSN